VSLIRFGLVGVVLVYEPIELIDTLSSCGSIVGR
jgi:hypothetical protein